VGGAGDPSRQEVMMKPIGVRHFAKQMFSWLVWTISVSSSWWVWREPL
jgi:hypothetical protein